MAEVREYRFTILITFGSRAPEGLSRGYLNGSRNRCVIEPTHQTYLPAVITRDTRPPPEPGVRAVLAIPLADGEAEEFFAPGQRFTIWADALVGPTVCGDGFVGYGVISSHQPQPQPLSAGRDREVVVRPDSSTFRRTEVRGGPTR
jgi:hypothetical protein